MDKNDWTWLQIIRKIVSDVLCLWLPRLSENVEKKKCNIDNNKKQEGTYNANETSFDSLAEQQQHYKVTEQEEGTLFNIVIYFWNNNVMEYFTLTY